jgi:hypothetical protein
MSFSCLIDVDESEVRNNKSEVSSGVRLCCSKSNTTGNVGCICGVTIIATEMGKNVHFRVPH